MPAFDANESDEESKVAVDTSHAVDRLYLCSLSLEASATTNAYPLLSKCIPPHTVTLPEMSNVLVRLAVDRLLAVDSVY